MARPAKEALVDCPIELADSMAIPKQQPGFASSGCAGQVDQTPRQSVEAHGIRVLTPSEIMRTLPSIGHSTVQNAHQPLQRVVQHETGHGQPMTVHHQHQTANQLPTVRIRVACADLVETIETRRWPYFDWNDLLIAGNFLSCKRLAIEIISKLCIFFD